MIFQDELELSFVPIFGLINSCDVSDQVKQKALELLSACNDILEVGLDNLGMIAYNVEGDGDGN